MAVQLPNFHPLRADLPDAAAMMEFGNLLKMCAFCEQEVQTVDLDQIFLNPALWFRNWPLLRSDARHWPEPERNFVIECIRELPISPFEAPCCHVLIGFLRGGW